MENVILVVDDDKIERDGIKFLIHKFSLPLRVVEAKNGQEALTILNQEEIHILLTDIQMPIMNGLELAGQVREHYPDIKVVILSAYGEFEYAQVALRLNVFNYILKPIKKESFREVMEEVIDKYNEDQKRVQQKETLENAYKKCIKYEKERLLLCLLEGREIPQEIKDRVLLLEEEYNGYTTTLVVVQFNAPFFDTIEDLFLQKLGRNFHYLFDYLNVNQYESILLIKSERIHPINRSKLKQDLEKVKSEIEKDNSDMHFWGIGQGIQRLNQLHTTYENIIMKLENKFFMEKSAIWLEEDELLEDGEATKWFSEIIEDTLKKIEELINKQSYETLPLYIEELFYKIKYHKITSRLYIKHVLVEILKKISDIQVGHNKEISCIEKNIEKIMKTPQLNASKEILLLILQDLTADTAETINYTGTIYQVLQMIHEQYGNPDMGVEYIASKVYLTPNYLSYAFKKVTGENINRYVTQYRMNKAKELLLASNLKIIDVCKKVGYTHQSYFSSIFKNYFGCTPAQLREKGIDV